MLHDINTFVANQTWENRSFVQQMLEIKDYELTQTKSFGWMTCLTYLSIEGLPYVTKRNRRDIVLREVAKNIFDADPDAVDDAAASFGHITISYTWEAAKGESTRKRGLRIRALDGSYRRNEVRDIIVWRAIRYSQHHGLKGFWIDRQCLDQEDDEQHTIAMNSMDLLYRRSPCSVGMTTTTIDQQWKLDALFSLITGSLTQSSEIAHADRLPSIPVICQFWRTVRWLVQLLSDDWWHRSWIFQEEYCAGRNMYILIPCKRHLARHDDRLGTMLDEIEVRAVDLRTELTKFAIACQRDERLDVRQKRYIAKCILHKAERYKVSYQYSTLRDQTLSSLTAADLQRRRITRPEDHLAILANCCGYTRRLHLSAIRKQDNVSLMIALFVQAVLNGEIMRNSRDCPPPNTQGYAEFFRQHTLTSITPSAELDTLAFTKHCRFVQVELRDEGVMTTGHLWRSTGVVPACPRSTPYSLSSSDGLRSCLEDLTQVLHPLQPVLARSIKHFATTLDQQDSVSKTAKFMTAMAKQVASAWATGHVLSVASLQQGGLENAIFVNDKLHEWFLTSWHSIPDRTSRDPEEPVDKHVWLALESSTWTVGQSLPMLRISEWAHGLCFFHGVVGQPVLFLWPSWMLRRTSQ